MAEATPSTTRALEVSNSIKNARQVVDLLSRQNDKYEEELRIQDAQERKFMGHKVGIEQALEDIAKEEDKIVEWIEKYAIDISKTQVEVSELRKHVLQQKTEATDVDTGIYNIRAAKQHGSILKRRLAIALNHISHYINGAAKARTRLDHFRRVRALADIKLAAMENSLAFAEQDLREQQVRTKSSKDALQDVRLETRKLQERVLAEKLEFDATVAEFRRQFLAAQHGISAQQHRPGAGKGKQDDTQGSSGAATDNADGPLHTIGEITLEQELAMTRQLRQLEDDLDEMRKESNRVQRSTMRARHLLQEIQREFAVPDQVVFDGTPSPHHQLPRAADAAKAQGATVPFSGAKAFTASTEHRRPTLRIAANTPAQSSSPPLHPPAPAPALQAESRGSVFGGRDERSHAICKHVVDRFNSSEDGHVALTRQIAQKELDVHAAEMELAAARKENDHFAPGNEYDMRRRAFARAEKHRDALHRQRRSIEARHKELEGCVLACVSKLSSLAEALKIDMITFTSPLEKLHAVHSSIERLQKLDAIAEESRANQQEAQRPAQSELPPRNRFSSLAVAVDTSGINPLELPIAANNEHRRRAAAEVEALTGDAGPTADVITKRLEPVSSGGLKPTGSAFIQEGARIGTRKVVLHPNTDRPSKVASMLVEPSWMTGVRPMTRAELERESVRALLPQSGRPRRLKHREFT